MIRKRLTIFLLAALLAAAVGLAAPRVQAQAGKAPKKRAGTPKTRGLTPAQLAGQQAKLRADVIKAAEEYKKVVSDLISLLEAEAERLAGEVGKNEQLLAAGLISKSALDESRERLSGARARVEAERKKIEASDALIAEVRAAEQLAKMSPVPLGGYRITSALIRYNGPFGWTLSDAAKVHGFFLSRFGRNLPVSAFGQTAVHDRMGFDHSNSMDVALHPDSVEGQALMAYLRGAGIPFIAFRQAVPGSATGAHIHVGNPSRRIFR